MTVSGWDPGPQHLSRGIVARAQCVGDDLAGTSAQSQPQPDHAPPPMTDEGPQLIQFQDIIRLGSHHSRRQRRHIQGFFFSHFATVLRDTPNIRVSPRREERS